MTELLILATPCGRMIEEAFRRGDTINVVPFGFADSIEVDETHILSADKYNLYYFEIVVIPYEHSLSKNHKP